MLITMGTLADWWCLVACGAELVLAVVCHLVLEAAGVCFAFGDRFVHGRLPMSVPAAGCLPHHMRHANAVA